jgi:ion channel POLLUX/CASTOR
MKQITWRDRLSYFFDDFLSSKSYSQLLGLFVLALLIILLGAAALKLCSDESVHESILSPVWKAFTFLIDPGSIGGDDKASHGLLFIAFWITFGGILVMSMLIGILTSQIEKKMTDLKKGKSFVLEKNHVLILGWNNKIFTIIEELIRANENQTGGIIVVLANEDKEFMEDEIRLHVHDSKTTKVICRSGEPIDLANLEMVNFNESKVIMVLGEEAQDTDSDTRNIKILMAVLNHPNRRKEPFRIVVEIQHEDNLPLIEAFNTNEIEPVLTSQVISRIVLQTSRQHGLSVVYENLLSFMGSEFYFPCIPHELVGETYFNAIFRLSNATMCGIYRDNKHIINPPKDTKLEENDLLLTIMEDDDKIVVTNKKPPEARSLEGVEQLNEPKPESVLILNWSDQIAFILQELDEYVAPYSTCLIFSEQNEDDGFVFLRKEVGQLKNLNVQIKTGKPSNRLELHTIEPLQYNSIIVLSDELKGENLEARDAKTLIILLILRELMQKNPDRKDYMSIVSEILSVRNKELATITEVNDFIVSNKIISTIFAQISEDKRISKVYEELFTPDGYEIYIKPIEYYLPLGKEISFADLALSANLKGEVAIGINIASLDESGYIINPRLDDRFTVNNKDKAIVLANK